MYNKRYNEEHRELVSKRKSKYDRQYRRTPKGRIVKKAAKNRRRLLECGLTTKIVQQVYEENILRFKKLTCELCGKPVKFGEDSLEHFHPVSRKDTYKGRSINERANLGVAHKSCNSQKMSKTLDEWFEIVEKE